MAKRAVRLASVAALAALALCGCGSRKPGAPAPDVGIDKLLQAPIPSLKSLSELRGQVVVLEFWATWCHPCVEKLPHMNSMVQSFEGRPVRFISVTTEGEEAVLDFLRTHPMKAWIGLDASRRVSQAFRVTGIPDVFIIDPYGRISLRVNPSFLYKSDIEKALKAAPPPPPPAAAKPSGKP